MADALDLESSGESPCEFESHYPHYSFKTCQLALLHNRFNMEFHALK